MKKFAWMTACIVLTGACGSTSAQPPRQPSAGSEARSKQSAQSAAPTRLASRVAGCDATVFVDLRRAANAPGVPIQLSGLWDELRRSILEQDRGARALEDLAKLGVHQPSDIASIEMCVPEVGSRRSDDEAAERVGFLIRGDFVAGTFLPLLMKWSTDVPRLSQYRGVDIAQLDDALFAQRPDGNLIFATHPSSLHALLDAPTVASSSGLAISAHLGSASTRWSRKLGRPLSSEAVRAVDLDLGPALDRIRVVVRARDAEAAAHIASELRGYVAELGSELRTVRDTEDAAGNALIEALQRADIRIDASTVTLDAKLPPMLAALVVRSMASELR